MGNFGLFGWLGIALLACGLCMQGVHWIREDAVADLRREIAVETARVPRRSAPPTPTASYSAAATGESSGKQV